MNIFVVDFNPETAGTVLPDKLCVKMVLETAQMLSTACRVHGATSDHLYKIAHLNHPCSKWCRETRDNFLWLYFHGLAIAKEYTARYGKIHKSQAIIELAGTYIDLIPEGTRTNFVQAMPPELQHTTDPTIAYRRYIITKPYWVDRPFRKGYDYSSFYEEDPDVKVDVTHSVPFQA